MATDEDGRPLTPAQRRRRDLGTMARFVAVGCVAALIGGIATQKSGLATPPWLVALAAFRRDADARPRRARRRAVPAAARPADRAGAPAPTDRESGGLRRVERVDRRGLRDVDRFNLRMRPWLIDLADQRLRHRAGIDPHHDPDTAHDLLGGPLWQLTQQPRQPHRRDRSWRNGSPGWRRCDGGQPRSPDARCHDVLDQVERAIVGKRAALELVLAGVLAGGHVLLQDSPGLGKTLAARTLAQTLGLPFRRVQFTPDLLPADVTGSFVWDQKRRRVPVPAGPAVRRAAARRRDQPHPAQDAVGAARGDAGAAGDRRGHHVPARATLPRHRDREPDRVRGHLPVARGPARPVPAAGVLRLPERRGRGHGARQPDLARPRGGRRRAGDRRGRPARARSRSSSRRRSTRASSATASRSPGPPASPARCCSAPHRAVRSRSC